MVRVVLLRHGESLWNRENRFTGWIDVDLSEKGRAEAEAAGRRLKQEGFRFDLAYTSVLKRAVRTLWLVLDAMDLMWLPVVKNWRLNERHYGALQGLNKSETAARFGEDQVQIWRRSYDVRPPVLENPTASNSGLDHRYADLDPADLPLAECLKDTAARFLPYWNGTIGPAIKDGRQVLIVAHGNSLRALVQHLEGLSADQVIELNIPTGIPLVYDLDGQLKAMGSRYIGDPDLIRHAQEAVAAQGRARSAGV